MVSYAVGLVFFLWLSAITWLLIKTKAHYDHLTSHTNRKKLDEVLEALMASEGRTGREITEIKKAIGEQGMISRTHINKIGLVRYNPFEKTGGEQSFVVTLLNEANDGIVINFIYTREGLRAYSKKVIKGESDKFKLSDEEKKAIDSSS